MLIPLGQKLQSKLLNESLKLSEILHCEHVIIHVKKI
jgi:hypothetical protein